MSLLCCLVTERVYVFSIHDRPKCQKELSYYSLSTGLMFSFKRDRQVSILSVFNTSRGLTKNLPPLIVDTEKNLFSSGSLCNIRVKMYSYPSSNSSCINIACDLKVTTEALEVCFVRQKSEICAQ